jgi:malic enzyme
MSKKELTVYDYHKNPGGKWRAIPSKPLKTKAELCLAYTPHVAEICQEIARNPETAKEFTNKERLVAVISNGTAVLGLGNIGPLASKPVMEGKAVLFQRFGGLNAIDIEIDETDPQKLAYIIKAIAPSFGAINLEDIKSPECFIVEKSLQESLDIPVFHDDQHGTAIVVSAALLNGLFLSNRSIENVRCVVSGAGAGALSTVDFFKSLGMKAENIIVFDRKGAIHPDRPGLEDHKRPYANPVVYKSFQDALDGAHVVIGLSGGGALDAEVLKVMAPNPIIFALANPVPEVCPMDAKRIRPDCILGTGRSDYPNQINNLLCFPYIFRGALDVGSCVINIAMKQACALALSQLARQDFFDMGGSEEGGFLKFGKEYLIPKPFDPRLLETIAPAVAKAAMDSGVATRPLNLQQYTNLLHEESRSYMEPPIRLITGSSYDQAQVRYKPYRPLVLMDKPPQNHHFWEAFSSLGKLNPAELAPTIGCNEPEASLWVSEMTYNPMQETNQISWLDMNKWSSTRQTIIGSSQKEQLLHWGMDLLTHQSIEHLVIGWDLNEGQWKNLCKNFLEISSQVTNHRPLEGLLVSGVFLDDQSVTLPNTENFYEQTSCDHVKNYFAPKEKKSFWKAQWVGSQASEIIQSLERLIKAMSSRALTPAIYLDLSGINQGSVNFVTNSLGFLARTRDFPGPCVATQIKQDQYQEFAKGNEQHIHFLEKQSKLVDDLLEHLMKLQKDSSSKEVPPVFILKECAFINASDPWDGVILRPLLSWDDLEETVRGLQGTNPLLSVQDSHKEYSDQMPKENLGHFCEMMTPFFLGATFDIQCFSKNPSSMRYKDLFSLFFHPIIRTMHTQSQTGMEEHFKVCSS